MEAEVRYLRPNYGSSPWRVRLRDHAGALLPELTATHRDEDAAQKDATSKLAARGGGLLACYDLNGFILDAFRIAPGWVPSRLSALAG